MEVDEDLVVLLHRVVEIIRVKLQGRTIHHAHQSSHQYDTKHDAPTPRAQA